MDGRAYSQEEEKEGEVDGGWGCKFTVVSPAQARQTIPARQGMGDDVKRGRRGDVRRRMEAGRALYLRRQEAVKWHWESNVPSVLWPTALRNLMPHAQDLLPARLSQAGLF
ncbi:hypothetical protein CORC01_11440 [Colletotrichum orchidophilum]|uniref:Uncharacterized protein n=1 Tax=Colletotrichum orchidophilum TaxID=1209926 RepID=A0A1G4AVX8_9PEZI|nr:uncharacterized protein CORC01_11440 [Colletotrichum orchidophilum]OHE93297.1 hypothetical protein CORC01_11440 [Colletotrichum orchidophilum]